MTQEELEALKKKERQKEFRFLIAVELLTKAIERRR